MILVDLKDRRVVWSQSNVPPVTVWNQTVFLLADPVQPLDFFTGKETQITYDAEFLNLLASHDIRSSYVSPNTAWLVESPPRIQHFGIPPNYSVILATANPDGISQKSIPAVISFWWKGTLSRQCSYPRLNPTEQVPENVRLLLWDTGQKDWQLRRFTPATGVSKSSTTPLRLYNNYLLQERPPEANENLRLYDEHEQLLNSLKHGGKDRVIATGLKLITSFRTSGVEGGDTPPVDLVTCISLKASGLGPISDTSARLGKAQCLFELGNDNDVMKTTTSILAATKNVERAHYLQGRSLERMGNTLEAVNAFYNCTQYAPTKSSEYIYATSRIDKVMPICWQWTDWSKGSKHTLFDGERIIRCQFRDHISRTDQAWFRCYTDKGSLYYVLVNMANQQMLWSGRINTHTRDALIKCHDNCLFIFDGGQHIRLVEPSIQDDRMIEHQVPSTAKLLGANNIRNAEEYLAWDAFKAGVALWVNSPETIQDKDYMREIFVTDITSGKLLWKENSIWILNKRRTAVLVNRKHLLLTRCDPQTKTHWVEARELRTGRILHTWTFQEGKSNTPSLAFPPMPPPDASWNGLFALFSKNGKVILFDPVSGTCEAHSMAGYYAIASHAGFRGEDRSKALNNPTQYAERYPRQATYLGPDDTRPFLKSKTLFDCKGEKVGKVPETIYRATVIAATKTLLLCKRRIAPDASTPLDTSEYFAVRRDDYYSLAGLTSSGEEAPVSHTDKRDESE